MPSFSTVAVALLVSLLSVTVYGQALTNVTGTATCNFTTMQATNDLSVIVQMMGWLTVNLTAGAYEQPNTPGFANARYLSYPIISMGGNRRLYNRTISPPTNTNNAILGIGADHTIYMTFDPSQSDNGYPTDGKYIYRLDYTGITILTNSTTLPSLQFAEVSNSFNNPYSELDLFDVANWQGASFGLSQCNANYTIDVLTDPAVSSSTGSGDPSGSSSSTGVSTPSDPSSSSGSSSPSGPSAVGDPSFTGFLGQHYQVHGMADTVYSVISDAMLQLNAQFVFLTEGQCPIMNGKPLTNCWSHPGSYFGSLALQTAEGDRLLIAAGSHSSGFTLTLNGAPLSESVSRTGLSVSIDSSFRAVVEAGLYRMQIENSDMFVNIAGIEVTDWRRLREEVQPHGLLGQTWQRRRGGAVIEGNVDDYVEADNALFGSQFLYSKFGKQ